MSPFRKASLALYGDSLMEVLPAVLDGDLSPEQTAQEVARQVATELGEDFEAVDLF